MPQLQKPKPESDIKMEGAEKASKSEAQKLETAVHCAKAAILLASLKSSTKFHLKTHQEEEKQEVMMREIRDLKMELVRERMKSRKIRLCGLMEVILQVLAVWCLSTFFLVLFLKLK